MFVGWTVYLIAAEEVHWRIHMDGWLPPGLRFARAYHMSHHDIPNARYNVFLPLFDCLLGNASVPEVKNRAKTGIVVR
jgi:sterol desaturase/sphingolipid hydroxylase (fatty acid hydroxylase superfamily)